MPRKPNLDSARRELERAALAWCRGLDKCPTQDIDMEKLDGRLFEACARFQRATDATKGA
jgi:hypothetical protein